MKVAIFTPTFLPKFSGAEIFHHNLAARLVEAGHDATVILPKLLHRRFAEAGVQAAYKTVPFPANTWSYFKYSAPAAFAVGRFLLSRLQSKHGFDVWHSVVLSPTGVLFSNWQNRCGIAGLVRPVGDDVTPVREAPGAMPGLVRQWIPRAQCVVSLSPEMTASLCGMGVEPGRIREVPNAVDHSRFAAAADKRELRLRLGIPPDAFVFLCVARNHPQKDLPTLFRAFSLLCGMQPAGEFHLAVAGRGVPQLQGEVGRMGLGGRVGLVEIQARSQSQPGLDFPPQGLVDLYRAADVFVLSSVLEGFSTALLEAMAAGLPIVASSAPGISGVLCDGRDALLCKPGAAESFAAGMHGLWLQPRLRSELAAAAQTASLRYGWETIVAEYAGIYRGLLQGVPFLQGSKAK